MSRRVYLYFAATFVLGVIIGGAAVYFYAWNTGHWHRGFNRDRVIQHLREELELSPPQVQQVTQIIDDEGKKYSDLQKQVEPQFMAVREDTRNRIRQLLTPQQLSKFNEMVRRLDERHHRAH
ncbi:MAG: hypothetical protein LAP13_27015 [Acidobacteriia bacterium]|nr:hypothetical protein [Terriglobia bacterium]